MSDGVPQFATAEYSGKPGGPACKSCGQAISGAYYRVNAALTCAACAQKIKELMPKDSHSASQGSSNWRPARACMKNITRSLRHEAIG